MRPSVESCVYRKSKPKRSGHEVRQVALNRLSFPKIISGLMMQPSQYRNGDIGARSLNQSMQGRIFV